MLVFAIGLGACDHVSKAMENNAVTDPIGFAKNILREWGYQNIPVTKDPTSFFSSAGSNGIFLGNEWTFFARKPELLKAILGHELMHIKHYDHVWMTLLGIPWYCVYRAAVAFFWAHGATCLINNIFKNNHRDSDWEEMNNDGGYLQYITLVLAPIITAYFSAAHINQGGQFILTKDPWSFALFVVIYGIITSGFSQAFGTFMDTITHALQTLFTTNTHVPALVSVIIPFLLHCISKYGSRYAWAAFKRLRERQADVDSALTFGTGAGLIKWLNALKERYPTDTNTEAFDNFHPTDDQRIAAIQDAITH